MIFEPLFVLKGLVFIVTISSNSFILGLKFALGISLRLQFCYSDSKHGSYKVQHYLLLY